MSYNVLYVHNQSDISGGERSLLGLWTHLDRSQFTPLVILPGEGPLSIEARRLGIDVTFLDFPKIHPFHFFACLKTRGLLMSLCRRQSIRLIHSYGPRNNIIASWAGKGLHIPVIWHERNIPIEDETDVTRRLMFLPDAVICNSRAVARRFVQTGTNIPAKVRVIHNGVDPGEFTVIGKDEPLAAKLGISGNPVVGIVTNLSVRRRVEHFVRIASIIHARRPDVRFLIVGGEFSAGSKGRAEHIRRQIDLAGLKDACLLTGFREDVRSYLSLCDVVCHVTLMDACSRSVLEAMACGKAVVGVNDGGNPELVESGTSGILVDGRDEQIFAEAVMSLLQDSRLRTVLGQAARHRTEKFFDIRRNTRETQGLYMELIRMRNNQ